MEDVVIVHVFVNSETSFPVEAFELSTSGLHEPEVAGEPWSRDIESDSSGFKRSKGVKDGMKSRVIVGNQFVSGVQVVGIQEAGGVDH